MDTHKNGGEPRCSRRVRVKSGESLPNDRGNHQGKGRDPFTFVV